MIARISKMAERLEQERLEQKRRQGEVQVEREEWRTRILHQARASHVSYRLL